MTVTQNNTTAVTVGDFTFQFHSTLSNWHNRYVLQALSPNPASVQNRLLHATSAGVCGLWYPEKKKSTVINHSKKWLTLSKIIFTLPTLTSRCLISRAILRPLAECFLFISCWTKTCYSYKQTLFSKVPCTRFTKKKNHLFTLCNSQSHNKIMSECLRFILNTQVY